MLGAAYKSKKELKESMSEERDFPESETYKDWDDQAFPGVTLKTLIDELEADLGEKIKAISERTSGWSTTLVAFETDGGKEYLVVKDEDEGEAYAREGVEEDLENEPEIFNQDWLNSLKDDKLEGESNDHAAEQALAIDGWQHFVCHYDGNSDTTKSGFCYWREN